MVSDGAMVRMGFYISFQAFYRGRERGGVGIGKKEEEKAREGTLAIHVSGGVEIGIFEMNCT